MPVTRKGAELLAGFAADEQAKLLGEMTVADLRKFDDRFECWADDGQLEPPGDWRVWLMIAGRGYGKTRAGAEWVDAQARAGGASFRAALVAATIAEARAVMIEGRSGLIAVAKGHKPKFDAGVDRLTWRRRSSIRARTPRSCAGPSIMSRGATSWRNGRSRTRRGTSCGWGCGWARAGGRW